MRDLDVSKIEVFEFASKSAFLIAAMSCKYKVACFTFVAFGDGVKWSFPTWVDDWPIGDPRRIKMRVNEIFEYQKLALHRKQNEARKSRIWKLAFQQGRLIKYLFIKYAKATTCPWQATCDLPKNAKPLYWQGARKGMKPIRL